MLKASKRKTIIDTIKQKFQEYGSTPPQSFVDDVKNVNLEHTFLISYFDADWNLHLDESAFVDEIAIGKIMLPNLEILEGFGEDIVVDGLFNYVKKVYLKRIEKFNEFTFQDLAKVDFENKDNIFGSSNPKKSQKESFVQALYNNNFFDADDCEEFGLGSNNDNKNIPF